MINARASHRYSTEDLGAPATFVRIYQASVERPLAALRMSVGRFYDPVQVLGGYWDGLMLRYDAPNGLSGGAAAGFEPTRANGLFSTERPRYLTFARYGSHRTPMVYETSLSISTTHPRQGLPTQTTVGAVQRVGWKGLRLDADGQLDRDPAAGGMEGEPAAGPCDRARRAAPAPPCPLRPASPLRLLAPDRPLPFWTDQYGGGLSYARVACRSEPKPPGAGSTLYPGRTTFGIRERSQHRTRRTRPARSASVAVRRTFARRTSRAACRGRSEPGRRAFPHPLPLRFRRRGPGHPCRAG